MQLLVPVLVVTVYAAHIDRDDLLLLSTREDQFIPNPPLLQDALDPTCHALGSSLPLHLTIPALRAIRSILIAYALGNWPLRCQHTLLA